MLIDKVFIKTQHLSALKDHALETTLNNLDHLDTRSNAGQSMKTENDIREQERQKSFGEIFIGSMKVNFIPRLT